MADELFSKTITVLMKSPDRDDRRTSVSIKIEMATVTTPMTRKELVVRVTDEKDLLFLYTLKIGEEDFQSLKGQQGLLIDFAAFPQRVIDLLEVCAKEEHKEVPKFVLQFVCQGTSNGEQTTAMMHIVETSSWKNFNHLSLKFIQGSDYDVKKHLADCLKQLKDAYSLLQKRQEHTEADLTSRLSNTQEMLTSKSIELDNLKAEWTAKLNDQIAKHKQELATEKERAYNLQSTSQQKYEMERRALEQSHIKSVQQFEGQRYELENINKDLTERRYKNEASIRDLKSKLSSLEDENVHMKQDIQSLRKQNASLDADYHEQEKIVNQLRMRVAVLEQELKDKEQVLTKSSDLLGSEQEKMKHYKVDSEAQRKEISRLTNELKTMVQENKKADEVIKKYQGALQQQKIMCAKLVKELEVMKAKEKELEQTRQDLANTKDVVGKKNEQIKSLQEQYEMILQKLEESQGALKTNENVINWLNKRETELQLQLQKVGMFEMPGSAGNFRPSSTALHNFSASSYGSTVNSNQLAIGDRANMVVVPQPVQYQHRMPQVQYNPVNPRKSAIPTPSSGAVPSIPEEIPVASGNLPGQKDSDPPLDPRYISKRDDAIALRGISSTRSASPPVMQPGPGMHMRLGHQPVAPKPTQPQQPPLASAYFPGKKGS